MAKASKQAASKTTKKAAAKAPAKAAKKAAPQNEAKKAAPQKSSKGASTKSAAPKKAARKPNPAFMVPLTPDNELAEVIGNKPIPRTEIISKMWDYIRKNNLQDPNNKRMINADDKLRPLFGKDQVSMFELAKVVNEHVKK